MIIRNYITYLIWKLHHKLTYEKLQDLFVYVVSWNKKCYNIKKAQDI